MIWGVGPTFIFPTASDNTLGQGKYQAGPAAVCLYIGKEWVFGALGQQWWSFAGDNGSRPGANQSNIQYFIQYLFGKNWQIGMAPNILIDWKADQGQHFTVPVGLGISKMVKIGSLPVKFNLEGDYMVVHPDDFGQRYFVRFQIIPVLPALFKGTFAVDILSIAQPDIVLIDYALYPHSGFEFLAKIREEIPDLHVILLGGRALLRERALDAGADDYLPMPITPRNLVNAIRQALNYS